jgi:hypothetical protein
MENSMKKISRKFYGTVMFLIIQVTNPAIYAAMSNNTQDIYWAKPYQEPQPDSSYINKTADGPITDVKLSIPGNLSLLYAKEHSSFSNGFTIYPSPTEGLIKINFSEDLSPPSEMVIYNLLGQIIYSEKIIFQTKYKTIDLKGREPGIYFLSIKSNNQLSTKKIILE